MRDSGTQQSRKVVKVRIFLVLILSTKSFSDATCPGDCPNNPPEEGDDCAARDFYVKDYVCKYMEKLCCEQHLHILEAVCGEDLKWQLLYNLDNVEVCESK